MSSRKYHDAQRTYSLGPLQVVLNPHGLVPKAMAADIGGVVGGTVPRAPRREITCWNSPDYVAGPDPHDVGRTRAVLPRDADGKG